MNIDKLKQAEELFFARYPDGFEDDDLIEMTKRHKMSKMIEFAQDSFTKGACEHIDKAAENMIRVISRSSMVSMFEKPKFRDFVRRLNGLEKEVLVDSMMMFLHGKKQGEQQLGFEGLLETLLTEKLAKWSLMTIVPAYYAPQDEVFIKPTTAKGVIAYFDVPELVYKPRPSWEFYARYRDLMNDSKTLVDARLSPSNAAFSGFLMMTMSGDF